MIKGAIVGVSAAVSIAVAMTISIAQGLQTQSPLLTVDDELVGVSQALPFLLCAGAPIGAAFGVLIGSLEISVMRRTAFAVLSLVCLLLCVPLWLDLIVPGAPLAVVHGLALARWTRREPVPRAVAR